jgi:hypothetical protein
MTIQEPITPASTIPATKVSETSDPPANSPERNVPKRNVPDPSSAGISRRRLLGRIGIGAAGVAVAGAGGITWRAADQGVFSSGEGPAYQAWKVWDRPGGQPQDLVAAAVLAANAHNSQPWRYQATSTGIDLLADHSRNLGTLDPLRREMYISLGCAAENLVLAAGHHGYQARITEVTQVGAHLALATEPAGDLSRWYPVIGKRHTNRGEYQRGRTVPATDLASLRDVAWDAGQGRVGLIWLTSQAQREAFGDLTVRATRAIIADPEQARDDFTWYRTSWDDIQHRKDGITIDASGQSDLIRVAAKILPVSREQNHSGWLRSTKQVQVPSAAGFGVLTVDASSDLTQDRALLVTVGRVWQRLHLEATLRELAMQPLCQVPERIDRETSSGGPGEFCAQMAALLTSSTRAVFAFRYGYPKATALASPRRPVSAVYSS